jgi:hypothetical protein
MPINPILRRTKIEQIKEKAIWQVEIKIEENKPAK